MMNLIDKLRNPILLSTHLKAPISLPTICAKPSAKPLSVFSHFSPYLSLSIFSPYVSHSLSLFPCSIAMPTHLKVPIYQPSLPNHLPNPSQYIPHFLSRASHSPFSLPVSLTLTLPVLHYQPI
ncbi:hypothetical protein AMTRI_Chr03g50980 [Amborella trichopoda]